MNMLRQVSLIFGGRSLTTKFTYHAFHIFKIFAGEEIVDQIYATLTNSHIIEHVHSIRYNSSSEQYSDSILKTNREIITPVHFNAFIPRLYLIIHFFYFIDTTSYLHLSIVSVFPGDWCIQRVLLFHLAY